VCAAGPQECKRLMVVTAAHAEDDNETNWEGNFRRCQIEKWIIPGQGLARQIVEITPADLPNMQKWITFLKLCDKFWTCVGLGCDATGGLRADAVT
jgi:hypothetical protein